MPSRHLFSCPFCFFHAHASLLTSFICLFLYLISFLLFPCQMFGKTLVHEFPISYSHTEWYFFFRSVKAMNNWKRSAIKQILLLLLLKTIQSDLIYLKIKCDGLPIYRVLTYSFALSLFSLPVKVLFLISQSRYHLFIYWEL